MTIWCLFRFHPTTEGTFGELIGIFRTEEEAQAELDFYDHFQLNYTHTIEEWFI